MTEVVAIAADHGGYELKRLLVPELGELGWRALDLGTHGTDPVDYPDLAAAVVAAVTRDEAARGVLICGTGIGMSIAANRHPAIRAALCHDGLAARLARQHNDANVLVLGGRIIGPEQAKECLRQFLATAFEGGRHARRVRKLGVAKEEERGAFGGR
jgi:ribose 5-phosphate isomerase B